jgi:type II secretory pathway component PulF
MSTFTYTAIDATGRQVSGNISAATRPAALEQVVQKGLTPVSVDEQTAAEKPVVRTKAMQGRVSQAAVEAFIRGLSNLLTSGVPLSKALSILSREAVGSAAKRQWTSVHDDVVGGMPLAEAMARWPRSFTSVHIAMIHAGETGGFLDTVLAQIADLRARERDLKGRIKSALVYPAVLAVLATGVLIFLLTFFIPKFKGMFDEFGGSLPPLTRLVIGMSTAVTHYGLVLLVLAAIAGMLSRRVLSSSAGRRGVERATLRVPGVGQVMGRFALVRFCRMLGTLLGAGVPLVTSLRVAREAIGNQTLADTVAGSIEQVQRGSALAASLATCGKLFPPSAVEMIAVAEQSGRLDKELVRLAAAYEDDLDRRLRMLVSLAEPALLFIMAAIVGTVVIGMLLPIFTLQDYIK